MRKRARKDTFIRLHESVGNKQLLLYSIQPVNIKHAEPYKETLLQVTNTLMKR